MAAAKPAKIQAKFNLQDIADKIRKTIKDQSEAKSISTGAEMMTPTDPSQFVVMPDWFQAATGGVLGLPYGYLVMIAGKPDSGKTSATIVAMQRAQEQGTYVILGDTERKTTKLRLEQWGVDPEKVARVQATNLEQLYSGILRWVDAIKDADPEGKILVVIDSLGNTPSFRESEVEDMDSAVQPGVAAKVNKRGLKKLIPRLERDQIAMLIINQTYQNLGGYGYTNTGGDGPNYFSALTFQTARKQWLENVVGGKKIRKGAKVVWNLYKNHLLDQKSQLLKQVELDITAEGIKLSGEEKAEE